MLAISEHKFFTILQFFLIFACGCVSEPTERRAGEAMLLDYGYFAYYPRYRLELPSILVNSTESRSYLIESLPNSQYSVCILLETAKGKVTPEDWGLIWDNLDEAAVSVEIEVVETGSASHRFAGRLARGWDPGGRGEEFWLIRPELKDLELGGSVAINLAVSKPKAELPGGFALKPVLFAGGIRI